MRMVSVGSGAPGVFAFGQHAMGIFAVGQEVTGVIALGQLATGVIAFGQLATGVVAVGQLARGVIAVGQGALGLVAMGMVAAGVLWCAGIGVGGTAGPGLVFGLLGMPRRRRLIAWARREPWDSGPRPSWRKLATSTAGMAVITGVWWVAAGQPLITALG